MCLYERERLESSKWPLSSNTQLSHGHDIRSSTHRTGYPTPSIHSCARPAIPVPQAENHDEHKWQLAVKVMGCSLLFLFLAACAVPLVGHHDNGQQRAHLCLQTVPGYVHTAGVELLTLISEKGVRTFEEYAPQLTSQLQCW